MTRKILTAIGILLLLLLIFIVVLLNSHSFQSFMINRLIKPVEKKANVDINFSQTGFDLHDGLFVQDLTIVDKEKVKLLNLDQISISPQSTIYSIIKGDLNFNSFSSDGVSLNVITELGDSLSNWDKFLQAFRSNTEKSANSDPVNLFVENLKLTDFKLKLEDKPKNRSIFFDCTSLSIDTRNIDLASPSIELKAVTVIDPTFFIHDCSTDVSSTKESKSETIRPENSMLIIDNFTMINGDVMISLVNEKYEDIDHSINDIDLIFRDVDFTGVESFSLTPVDISMKYEDKFDLTHSSSARVEVNSDKISLDDLIIRSNLGLLQLDGMVQNRNVDDPSLEDYSFSGSISNSKIDISELAQVLPSLKNQDWYKSSRLGDLYINAIIDGGVKDLSLSEMTIVSPGIYSFQGAVDISDLKNIDKALISLDVANAQINMDGLKSRMPGLPLPKQIYRLGQIEITGLFDGFLNDFVAESRINSSLGSVNMDLNFGIDESNSFRGYLEMISFDLGRLLDSEELGVVSFDADIFEGSGTNFENLRANFKTNLDTFQFRGYTYSNAFFNGIMTNKAVDGVFKIDDPNADLTFDGTYDFSSDVVDAKFDIDLERINLCELNLTDFPCFAALNGSIDMHGKDLNSLQGVINLDSITMRKNGEELNLEYLEIISAAVDQGMMLDIASEELDAKIRGEFDLRTMHKVLLNLLVSDYPDIANRLNIERPTGIKGTEEFDFAIEVKDMKDILSFLESKQLFDIQGELRGRWSSQKGLTSNSYNLEKVGLNGISFENVVFNLDSKRGDGSLSLYIDELIQGDRVIDGFLIRSEIIESEVFFNIKNHDDQEDRINISGRGNPWKDGFKFVFENDVFQFDSVQWELHPDAEIGYSNKEIFIQDFILKGDDKTLTLDDVDGKGLSLQMEGFPLNLINPIIDYDKMYFDGTTNVDIVAENLFGQREVSASIEVPDFTINGDDYGKILIKGTEGNGGLIDASIKIQKDTQSVDILAYYDLKENLINADISIDDYPMSIFEYIIDDGISRTSGTTDINARIYGEPSDLKLQGQGVVKNGGTRIDYIGEYYRMDNQVIKLNESKIYLTDVELMDHLGNVAVIKGDLNHDFFSNMRTDLSISSDRMIGLFTTREDNELYYGTGLGDMTVSFFGPFSEIDIKVDAIAGEGSILNIPLESNEYSIDKGFVNFDYKDKIQSDSAASELFEDIQLSGVDFEMNLSFTPQAQVNVIFDESVDEVLRARGSGDMRVSVKRDGAFEVFGNYLVESGDYLYSSYGLTAKQFLLRQGGIVRWTGDPYNAFIDVEADYTGMRAPLDIFLSEFLVSASEQVQQEAKNRTDVGLKLLLGGTLFKPDVDFDISFPNVAGELKAYTDNKMRSLRATENGINNQVFGLMIFNNFLPSNNPLASLSGSTLGQTGSNTITEFFSSQLSLLVSDALSDLVKDGSFINDIDLDIGLSKNTSFIDDPTQNSSFIEAPDQYSVNVRPTFNNDNWALNLGTNYVRESNVNNANYLTGDFALDWFITDDKKLKLRFYGDFNYDEAFASRRQKYGFGINYRREFGKMSELSETLKKIATEISNNASTK